MCAGGCSMRERVSDKMCGDVRRRGYWTLLRVVGVVYLAVSLLLVTVHGDNGGDSGDDYKYHKVYIFLL